MYRLHKKIGEQTIIVVNGGKRVDYHVFCCNVYVPTGIVQIRLLARNRFTINELLKGFKTLLKLN